MATFGWIGVGEMGRPMAARLIAAGHDVVVWGRTAARLRPLLDAGATSAQSPADLASRCDTIFLCVTDGDAVEAIVFGADGLAQGLRPGSLIIDHSTIHPETTRAIAARLRTASVAWVDAPVSGGAGGAEAGTLAIFLGGDAADVARAGAVVVAYASNITHIGPVGSGQVAKSCNQAIVASTIAMWAEVIAYTRRCGIDPDLLVDALEGGWADSPIRKVHAHDMVAGRFRRTPGSIILKDLEIIGDMARRAIAPMPVTAAVTSLFRSIVAQGHETGGAAAIMQLYADEARERAPGVTRS